MVQIKEYTQREGLQPVNRGALRINKPDIFANAKNAAMSKKPLETMESLAELGVAMKDRHDDAVASAFVNQYNMESVKQINDFKQKYKGLNAGKIIDVYNKWNEDYMGKYSSYDKKSDDDVDHVYLENKEQMQKAKQYLDKQMVSTINTLSNYVGSEEETARKNALSASISNMAEAIAGEDVPENIELYGANIKNALSALYKGQPAEFINDKAKKMMDTAVSTNLMNIATKSPEQAISLFDQPIYANNMSNKTKKATKENIQKMYQSSLSNQIAEQLVEEDLARGKEITPEVQDAVISRVIDEALSNKFFDNVSKRDYKAKNKKKRLPEKRAQIFNEKVTEQAKVQNEALLNISNLTNMGDEWNLAGADQGDIDTVLTTYKGLQTMDLLGSISNQEMNESYMLENGVELPDPTPEQNDAYRSALANLRSGQYKAVGDMSEDISVLPVDYQKKLIAEFLSEYNYNKQSDILKKKTGSDVDKTILESYKYVTGLDPKKSEGTYNIFRNEVVNNINAQLTKGEKFTLDLVKNAATETGRNLWRGETNIAVARRLVRGYDEAVRENSTTKTLVNEDFRMQQAKDVIDNSSISYEMGEAAKEELARYIVNGDAEMIEITLTRLLKAEAKKAERKKALREEKDRVVKEFYDKLFDFSEE